MNAPVAKNQKQSELLAARQVAASTQLIQTVDEGEFEVVEESKGPGDKGYKKYHQKTQGGQAYDAKVKDSQKDNSKQLTEMRPQQTKKRQKQIENLKRVNAVGNRLQGNYQRRGIREPSYEVKPEWPEIQRFNKQRFDKLANLKPGVLDDELVEAGQCHVFNKDWEKCSTRKFKKLSKFKGKKDINIFEDDNIKDLVMGQKANVYMTDKAAAAIMCSSKAVWSWDLEFKKQNFGKLGTVLFVDKRDEENMMDFENVSETALHDFLPLDDDSKNGVRQLMQEASQIQ